MTNSSGAQRTARRSPAKTSQALTALNPEGVYRLAQFSPSIVPYGKSKWAELVKSGAAPAPVVRQPRATLWRGQDILDFVRRCGGVGSAYLARKAWAMNTDPLDPPDARLAPSPTPRPDAHAGRASG